MQADDSLSLSLLLTLSAFSPAVAHSISLACPPSPSLSPSPSQVSLRHLGHWRKLKGFGPPANSPESVFDCEGKRMTVADYFVAKGKAAYGRFLKGGRLRCVRTCAHSCVKCME